MDTSAGLNHLKKHIFYEFLSLTGRAFILVRHSENALIGNRGFSAEEKENGITLIFNSKMNFEWDEYGITATLVFGTSPQKCFIPVDDIIAVYSTELNARFVAASTPQKIQGMQQEGGLTTDDTTKKPSKSPGNVIKIDFTKKSRK